MHETEVTSLDNSKGQGLLHYCHNLGIESSSNLDTKDLLGATFKFKFIDQPEFIHYSLGKTFIPKAAFDPYLVILLTFGPRNPHVSFLTENTSYLVHSNLEGIRLQTDLVNIWS